MTTEERRAVRPPGPRPATESRTALSFRREVGVEVDETGTAAFRTPTAAFALRGVPPALGAALARLAAGPALLEDVLAPLDARERTVLTGLLGRSEHLLARTLLTGDRPLLRLEVTAVAGGAPAPVPLQAGTVVRLCRFALLRSRTAPSGDVELVLESPRSAVRVALLDPTVRALVAELGAPLATSSPLALAVLPHLVGAGVVEVATAAGCFRSDTDPTLRQWDVHDLLMHSRVRSGRYDDPLGAVYPYRGAIAPQPAVRPLPEGPVVDLARPSWDDLAARDPSLTVALEGRRSVREHGEAPMTVAQLGELLYRVARVRAHHVPEDGTDEAVSRPYPSGGRSYELEVWLTVRRCAGLSAGIYYYDPVGHRLVLVNEVPEDRDAMLGVAGRATGVAALPDVLVTLTARFQRVSWKYRSIAYATTLRHTGVVYQTMYLVATAMGLAACGLGNGDADLSARVLGLDPLVESSVGDFLIGSRPAGDVLGGEPPAAWRQVNSPEWPLAAAAQLGQGAT